MRDDDMHVLHKNIRIFLCIFTWKHFQQIKYHVKNKQRIKPEHIERNGADGISDNLVYFKCVPHLLGYDTRTTNTNRERIDQPHAYKYTSHGSRIERRWNHEYCEYQQ